MLFMTKLPGAWNIAIRRGIITHTVPLKLNGFIGVGMLVRPSVRQMVGLSLLYPHYFFNNQSANFSKTSIVCAYSVGATFG